MTSTLRAREQRITPRGLNREQVSAYIGISATTFDALVAKGYMPPPRMLESRRVWDIHEVDQAFDMLPHADPFHKPSPVANSAKDEWN